MEFQTLRKLNKIIKLTHNVVVVYESHNLRKERSFRFWLIKILILKYIFEL